MRCPYCQQNIRVQGRFCPKCGEQIFGLPVRPPGAPPGTPPPASTPAPAPAPRPAAPAPPPYQPFPQQQPRHDYDDIQVEAEPAAAPAPAAPSGGAPGAPHQATREEVGKTCPYCRFPIKPDEQVIACPACKLPHHADCWTENRGCTTYGCRGAAGAAPMPTGPTPAMPSTLSPTGGQVPGLDYLRANELTARANNALYLAIIGLFCLCLPVGLVGLFMALAVLGDVNRMQSRAGDARGKAIAAIVIAIVAVVAWVVYLVIAMAHPSGG
ncbi:hypothetical protein LLH23_23955 [bacterium]|nr:hypothetical protein [bacterium]